MNESGIWAVVPVKDMADAKQRLAGVLSAGERRALFRAMTEDVLAALAGTPGLAGVLLVTRDAEARALAKRYGARVLVEKANRGHTEAARLGARTLAAAGAAGMLQVPADIPLLGAEDVAALLDAHGSPPAVTVAPSRDRRGSNAVLSSPPDLLPLRFGEDSFFPHLVRARALGVEPRVVMRAALALDVDTPEDLAALMAQRAATRAHRYLHASGVGARVCTGIDPQATAP